jgi:broad specificity phosphatase PhoE
LWEQAEKVERAKGRYDRRGKDRRHFNQAKVDKAWAKATAAFEEACRKDRAWERAVAALKVLRPDGQLNDRAWAEQELRAVAAELTGTRWAKVRRQLLDKRSLTFLDRLHEELALAEPSPERRAALVALWRWCRSASSKVKVGRGQGGKASKIKESAGQEGGVGALLLGLVRARLGEGWQDSYKRVSRVLGRVVRASSAVECVNSVVRMHQSRHRNLSQALLDLKRLYWNCRGFREGQRKGRCPYELLGLKLPSYDPWSLLQLDPDQLEQLLSSPALAA